MIGLLVETVNIGELKVSLFFLLIIIEVYF